MEYLINLAISLAVAVAENTADKLIEAVSKELSDAITEFFTSLKNLSEPTFKAIKNIRVVKNNPTDYFGIIEGIKETASNNYHFQKNINTLGDLTKEFLKEKNERTILNPEEKKVIDNIELILSEIAQDFQNKINIDRQSIQTSLNTTEELTNRFSKAIENFHKIKSFFIRFPLDTSKYKINLEETEKILDYTKPYTISLVGKAGVGKSTLINALLKREILRRRRGAAVTAVKTKIMFDIESEEKEKVILKFENESSLKDLVKKHVLSNVDELDHDIFNKDLNDILDWLIQLKEENSRSESDSDLELKKIISKLEEKIKSHRECVTINNSTEKSKSDEEEIILDSEDKFEDISKRIDKNSGYNSDYTGEQKRPIKSVTYHLKPQKNKFDLLNNVCLLDLPGLGANELHDLLMKEGIEEDSDAIILVINDNTRFGDKDEGKILTIIKDYISKTNKTNSGNNNVFLVNNEFKTFALGQYEEDKHISEEELSNIGKDLGINIENNYIKLNAEAGMIPVKIGNKNNIEDIKDEKIKQELQLFMVHYKIKENGNYENLGDLFYEKSNLPELIKKIENLLESGLVQNRINIAKENEELIINKMIEEYTNKKNKFEESNDLYKFNTVINNFFAKNKKENLTKSLYQFRRKKMDYLTANYNDDSLESVLNDKIYNFDSSYGNQLVNFWKNSVVPEYHRPDSFIDYQSFLKQFIGDAKIAFWEELSLQLKKIANTIVDEYQESFVNNSDIVAQIISECLEIKSLEEIKSSILQSINNIMREKMTKFGETVLFTLVNWTENIDAHFEYYKEKLKDISRDKYEDRYLISTQDFDKFIPGIKEKNNQIIKEAIKQIVNLQNYEMLEIQEKIIDEIDIMIDEIIKTDDEEIKKKRDAIFYKQISGYEEYEITCEKLNYIDLFSEEIINK